MCVQKMDKKTLDKICEDAIEADKSTEDKVVKSYDKKNKERHYESFNYEYVDWRGKVPYIPGPNEKKKKNYDRDGT